MLHTLGGLRWADGVYRREKPLLLLAYLALEGQQARSRLARLFWPEAANPANSLAQHLVRLRPLQAVQEDGSWIQAAAECDAALMRQHFRTGQWEAGLALYGGAFLAGLNLELNPDLEEWLLDTREALAAQAQSALLTLARQAALELDYAAAARHAERCHTLAGAAPLDTNALSEVYGFLTDAHHPHAEVLRREAHELGLVLREPAPFTYDTPPKFHLLLALTDHLPAIRAALRVSAAELTHLRREREQAGEAAHAAAQAWLEAHPLETPLLHLEVARHLPAEKAWLHYEAARELWEESDAEAVARAAHHFAGSELRRGYPARAARVLEGVKQTEEVRLLRAWGLLQTGQAIEARSLLECLPNTPNVLACKAMNEYKLGHLMNAKKIAESIPQNGDAASAYSFFVLASIAFSHNQHQIALSGFNQSSKLFHLNDHFSGEIYAANMAATVKCRLGWLPHEVFPDIVSRTPRNSSMFPIVTGNYAESLKNNGEFSEAEELYREAIEACESLHSTDLQANYSNSYGVILHLKGDYAKARELYKSALQLLRGGGNLSLLGLVLSNLSEIKGDLGEFRDALELLKLNGHGTLVKTIIDNTINFNAEDLSSEGLSNIIPSNSEEVFDDSQILASTPS